jgi:HEAT repeat protein
MGRSTEEEDVMKNTKRNLVLVASMLAGIVLLSGKDARSDGDVAPTVEKTYGKIPADQVEFLSTGERIKSVTANGSMTAIWETLEHGERVECLDCIPAVEPLIYDANPRTREIAAWWLRRRMFGVFGKGEVYERTVNVLKSDPNANRRASAAYALGEFLATPGIEAVSNAIKTDADGEVRAAAAWALGRLNSDGAGALSTALADADPRVKHAALGAASRINGFTDRTAVVRLLGDGDASVRRRAAELSGSTHAKEAVVGLLNLAKTDPDAQVRLAACHALGMAGDGSLRGELEAISKNDQDGFVRDMATIALRRL